MRVIHPHVEDVVRITCSCGCDDYIQFNRYLDSYTEHSKEREELYHLQIEHDSENWPLSIKLRELFLGVKDPDSFKKNGKKEYHHSMMISPSQAEKLYNIIKEDIENFDEETADYILQRLEDFQPIDKQVDEYTHLISDFNCDLMWIGCDGVELESPPNPKAGFYPHDVVIGWRFDDNTTRRDIFRGWKYFLRKGVKYNISTFDAILGKEDIVSILGSIRYMLDNIFQEPELQGVVKL